MREEAAVLKKIVFENFSAGGTCKIFHHGIVNEWIQDKSFELHIGTLNGIIGEFGNGGYKLRFNG